MLEVLKFIFSSFWVWAGMAMMIGFIGGAMALVVRAYVCGGNDE